MTDLARIPASDFDIDRVVRELRYGTPPEHLDILFASIEEIWDWRCKAGSIATAARKLVALMDSLLAKEIGDREVRFDDTLLRVKPDRKLTVPDADALFDFLGDDARHAFRAETVRLTALEAVARKRAEAAGMIDEKEIATRIRTVRDSLVVQEEGDEPKLQVLPMSKAPTFAAVMEPGVLYDDAGIKEIKRLSRSKAKTERDALAEGSTS